MFFQVFPGLRRQDSLGRIVFGICSFRYRELLRISICHFRPFPVIIEPFVSLRGLHIQFPIA